jgi:hypothetical protein
LDDCLSAFSENISIVTNSLQPETFMRSPLLVLFNIATTVAAIWRTPIRQYLLNKMPASRLGTGFPIAELQNTVSQEGECLILGTTLPDSPPSEWLIARAKDN